MTVHLPKFYGVIVRKSDRTAGYVARCHAGHQERYPGQLQNEDKSLLAISIAMSGGDADSAARAFERMGWKRGVDFVMTVSGEGLREPLTAWLEEFEFTPDPADDAPRPRMPEGPHRAYRVVTGSPRTDIARQTGSGGSCLWRMSAGETSVKPGGHRWRNNRSHG